MEQPWGNCTDNNCGMSRLKASIARSAQILYDLDRNRCRKCSNCSNDNFFTAMTLASSDEMYDPRWPLSVAGIASGEEKEEEEKGEEEEEEVLALPLPEDPVSDAADAAAEPADAAADAAAEGAEGAEGGVPTDSASTTETESDAEEVRFEIEIAAV